jgi:hypothetical protein
LLTAPAGIAAHGREDFATHGLGILGRVEQRAGLGERVLVMDLEGIVVNAWCALGGWLLHGFSPRSMANLTLSGPAPDFVIGSVSCAIC